MRIPKLKHPLLCRIGMYVTVLGAFIAPMVAVISIPVFSEITRAIVSCLCMVGLLVYMFRNFAVLMALDIFLGSLQGYVKAYRRYPWRLDTEAVEKRLSRFGKACDPTALQPKPYCLRYKKHRTDYRVFQRY